MKSILILTALFLSASVVSAAKPEKGDAEAAFKKLDANSDASVTKEEYLTSKRAQKDSAKATKRFEKLDANKDGKLTKEEFGAGEKKAETPAPAPAKPEEKKPAEAK